MQGEIFDRALVAQRRRVAAAAAVEGADVLMRWAADELAFRAGGVERTFETAIVLGGHGQEAAAEALAALANVRRVVHADALTVRGNGPPDVRIDEERLPFADACCDLVVSPLQLHTINDVPGVFVQIRRMLRPDGLFLAAVPAGDTLNELATSLAAAEIALSGGASPRVVPLASLQSLAGLLQRAGFALPVADVDRLTLRYGDMHALLRDLRAMGETSALLARSRRPPPRRLFERAAAIYAERFSDSDGRIRATFALASLSGWKPHPSQQQPLRPGSAKARLADALGTTEVPLPERGGGG